MWERVDRPLLAHAIEALDVAGVSELLAAGEDPNGRDPASGGSLLHLAVEAPIDVPGQTGRELVFPSETFVRLLLEAGADPNAPNHLGWTALDEAVFPLAVACRTEYHPAAAALLRSAGARHSERGKLEAG